MRVTRQLGLPGALEDIDGLESSYSRIDPSRCGQRLQHSLPNDELHVSPDEAEQGQSTVPRMVGEAEGVAVVNRRERAGATSGACACSRPLPQED
jgi:hypothetical protein